MRSFTPHLAILPPAQRQLGPELAPTSPLDLVLYGGTAIALRLGHRASVDFDFFTDRPLDRPAIHRAFPFIGQSTVLQDQPATFTVLTPDHGSSDQVKVSFFDKVAFGRVGEY